MKVDEKTENPQATNEEEKTDESKVDEKAKDPQESKEETPKT